MPPQGVLDLVLPILGSLAIDEGGFVKEALFLGVVHVIWWVVTCRRAVWKDVCNFSVSD